MRKLVESTHVSLGGEIGSPQDWASPYLADVRRFASGVLVLVYTPKVDRTNGELTFD